jgi:hypothetical protein
MPAWPKFFYTFGISLKTAATEWKLRKKRGSIPAQQRALAELTPRLAASSHWKKAGIESTIPYAKFQSGVPLSSYEHLAPSIEKMMQGEADVLWPGRCALFALTSGSSTGRPRHVPVTEEMLAHFRDAGLDSLLYYTVRVKNAGAFRGRHLLVGGPTKLEALPEVNGHKAFTGQLSGIAGLSLPAWAEKHLYEPGTNVGELSDWDAKLEATVARSAPRDVTLVAGLPNWMPMLASLVRERCSDGKRRISHVQGHWPNLECFVYGGTLIAPYANELRTLLGPTLNFHEVYVATEGFIAAQDREAVKGLRLMADTGIFFEFLAMTDFDESKLEQLGPKAVPLEEVKAGKDYAIVITTPGGLARYVLGDVVRFVSTEPPRLIYVGGTRLRLHAFGENVSEREVTDALVGVCLARGWTIVNFHVAPLIAVGSMTREQRGRHEWWIELRPGTIATPTGPQMARDLDTALQTANERYSELRKTGVMDAPFVRLVMPGVFEHWMRFHEKWGGQEKMPRCRSDRLVADELARVTNFARD